MLLRDIDSDTAPVSIPYASARYSHVIVSFLPSMVPGAGLAVRCRPELSRSGHPQHRKRFDILRERGRGGPPQPGVGHVVAYPSR